VIFTGLVTIVPADSLPPAALTDAFNAGYSEYLVPLRLDQTAFRDHVAVNDIDLACSRVVLDGAGAPVALALTGRRGDAGWVGGMGTAPEHRRRGHGERALAAALEAARADGCREMWLEVIDRNAAAIRLYEKLGFKTVREVTVWSLTGNGTRVPAARPVDSAVAHAWITGNRASREPWQRADESIARMRAAGVQLHGLVVAPGSDMAAAVVFREDPELVSVLQIAALDPRSAEDALLATAAGRTLRLANAPAGEPADAALGRLEARRVVRQREMRLAL
jgi:ribosomal protein S18 acetylase RimI-like enzyme